MAAADKLTCIKDLRPGMKNVSCVFIVIDRGSTHQIKDGSTVRKCRVADRTGSVCFSLWNDQAEAVEAGDILRLVKGYASLWKGTLVLYSGKYGQLEKIGEFTMVFSEFPDMSDSSHDFVQTHQKEKESHQDGRNSHHDSSSSRNSNGYGSLGGDTHARGGQNSGRPGSGQHGDGRRGYAKSPDYRPSPPHTYTSSHTTTNTHSTQSLSLIGGPLHSQNTGPLRTRHETAGSRYQPYNNRR